MDSKVVNKAIAQKVRPILKANGFSSFSSRTAWRVSSDQIDVVNFQSFNSYLAGGVGCTTYSFSVNLGCYFLYIPDQYPIKEKNGHKQPEEYHCHFRSRLHRSFDQQELARKDIWYIDPAGVYLSKAIADVCFQLTDTGFPWFSRFSDARSVLAVLRDQEQDMENLWGFGNNPSPIRFYMIGYVARKLGLHELAQAHLREAVKSGCFKHLSIE